MVVLREDRLLQALQRRARLEAESSTSDSARVSVALERLGLSARAVEREHQLATQPLPVGILGDQCLELPDQIGVASEREIGLDPLLHRCQPQVRRAARSRPERTARTRGRRAPVRARGRARPARQSRRVRDRPARAHPAFADQPLEAAAGRARPARLRAGSRAGASAASRPAAACAAARRTPAGSALRSRAACSPRARRSTGRARERGSRAGAAARVATAAWRPRAAATAARVDLERTQDPILHRRLLQAHVYRPANALLAHRATLINRPHPAVAGPREARTTPTTRKVVLAAVGMTAVLAIAAPGRRPQPSKTHATPTAASDEIIVRMEAGASVFGSVVSWQCAGSRSMDASRTRTSSPSRRTAARRQRRFAHSTTRRRSSTRPRTTSVAHWDPGRSVRRLGEALLRRDRADAGVGSQPRSGRRRHRRGRHRCLARRRSGRSPPTGPQLRPGRRRHL